MLKASVADANRRRIILKHLKSVSLPATNIYTIRMMRVKEKVFKINIYVKYYEMFRIRNQTF